MAAVEPDIALAEAMFARLRAESLDEPGVTRDAYGKGEERAHKHAAEVARELGLEVAHDFAGNHYFTLPGEDRQAKALITGSHLDSVPHGGNYDGAAGVVAGLAAVAGLKKAGIRPRRDIVVMATRAEESCWFPVSFPGSKAALGMLPGHLLDELRRSDTGRTLAEHMAELGYDPAPIRRGESHLRRERILGFLEAHIEQGPELIEQDKPIAIVTAITGGFRFREGRIFGSYAHCGGAPRRARQDAVAALAELITGVNAYWAELEAQGHYLLCTFGVVGTDPAMHTWSKVPGEARWTLDVRSVSEQALSLMRAHLDRLLGSISQRHGVRIETGPDTGPKMGPMDEGLRGALKASARARGIPYHEMPSGGGHDALTFTYAGIPAAMIFIRNQNGSHNPHEAMEIDDFAQAARVMADYMATL